jgi:hypothetical protein
MHVRSFRRLTFALPSLAALAQLPAAIAMGGGVSNAAAQTDKYPRMAAIGQYQMEESAEIQLARSAAPNSISGAGDTSLGTCKTVFMPRARHGGKRVQDIAAMIVTDASDCGDALGEIELFRSERMVVLPLFRAA